MASIDELKAEENELNVLTGYLNQGIDFLSSYGWYLLGLGLLAMYFRPYIEDKIDRIQRSKEKKEFEAKCKKDPTLIESQRQAVERAREKMQEEHDKKAALHAEKMKEREEKKREELLLKGSSGHRLGDEGGSATDKSTAKKKSWRPDYNPLSGSGSTGYRPPRRSGCSGGGCG